MVFIQGTINKINDGIYIMNLDKVKSIGNH